MKAIILAAGKSSRLYPITLDKPKCLLEIEKGKTIIEHQIEMLKKNGVEDIIVIVGYLQDMVRNLLGDNVKYHVFNDFAKFNNLHTLYSAKDELDDDVIVLYSDVVLGENLLAKCVKSEKDFCLLVHNKEILKDTVRVKIKDGGIIDIGNHISVEDGDGNFIGIAKFSKDGIRKLVWEIESMIYDSKHDNDYYITPLIAIAQREKIGFEFAGDEKWIEIDFLRDYEKAKKIYMKITH